LGPFPGLNQFIPAINLNPNPLGRKWLGIGEGWGFFQNLAPFKGGWIGGLTLSCGRASKL